ncbi:Transcription initiation factor TFIID subunit 4 [Liparis tanakae]|uniref:Transcription initiation factor TFIID subunit 4 n=1 Tax=Liparis tanakae TaxID=230148 RepID=A0A4Z2H8Q9_9TELE|nr:Transcription initiation factor TFIID subunit 4 [Liparis tanakae]
MLTISTPPLLTINPSTTEATAPPSTNNGPWLLLPVRPGGWMAVIAVSPQFLLSFANVDTSSISYVGEAKYGEGSACQAHVRARAGPGALEVSGSTAFSPASCSSPSSSSRQYSRQRVTRVNLRDFIFYMEQERATAHSLLLYRALLK